MACHDLIGGPLTITWEVYERAVGNERSEQWAKWVEWLPKGYKLNPDKYLPPRGDPFGVGVEATAWALWNARESQAQMGDVIVHAFLRELEGSRGYGRGPLYFFFHEAYKLLPRHKDGLYWHHAVSTVLPGGISDTYQSVLYEVLETWKQRQLGKGSAVGGYTIGLYDLCKVALAEFLIAERGTKFAALVQVPSTSPKAPESSIVRHEATQ